MEPNVEADGVPIRVVGGMGLGHLKSSETVVAGEKRTTVPDYYMERGPLGSNNSEFVRVVEPYRHGLRFGPDPASSNRATLGGMLGTNATGTHSIQYGSVVDHVLAADVLLRGGVPATFEALGPDAWAAKMRLDGLEGEIYRGMDALLNVHGVAIDPKVMEDLDG